MIATELVKTNPVSNPSAIYEVYVWTTRYIVRPQIIYHPFFTKCCFATLSLGEYRLLINDHGTHYICTRKLWMFTYHTPFHIFSWLMIWRIHPGISYQLSRWHFVQMSWLIWLTRLPPKDYPQVRIAYMADTWWWAILSTISSIGIARFRITYIWWIRGGQFWVQYQASGLPTSG